MYEISFPVRYYECDPMGVVHHSVYIRYFELARSRWLDSLGYTSKSFDDDFLVTPVVSVDCRYRHPVRFGGLVRVTAEVTLYTGARFTVHHQVYDEQGNLCAEGDVTLCFQSTVTGRPGRCPAGLDSVLKAIDSETKGTMI